MVQHSQNLSRWAPNVKPGPVAILNISVPLERRLATSDSQHNLRTFSYTESLDSLCMHLGFIKMKYGLCGTTSIELIMVKTLCKSGSSSHFEYLNSFEEKAGNR